MIDNVNIVAAASTFNADLKAFRSAMVAGENKATPMARSMLAAMLVGVADKVTVVADTITSFGNPKSPKSGKVITTLRGLDDFVGGGSVRKTVETVLFIAEHGSAALVSSFILSEDGCPKSIKALSDAVKAEVKAASVARDAAEGEPSAEGEPNADVPPVANPLADRINALTVAWNAATAEQRAAVAAEMAALFDAVTATTVADAPLAIAA